MLEIISVVVVAPLVLWFLYWFYWMRYYERYLKIFPGPTTLPLIGNALEFASSIQILPVLLYYYKKYKTNIKGYIGTQPFLFLFEVKDVESVLNSTKILTKSYNYKLLHDWLGAGLLTSTGDKWRKHRKILTPAFHFQILEEFIDVFNSASYVFVSKLEAAAEKGSFDLYPLVARCTLDIICETAMGTFVNAQNDINSDYVRSVNALLEIHMKRVLSPILGNEFLYPFTKTYRREQEALKVVHNQTKHVFNQKKAEFLRNQGKVIGEVTDPSDKKKTRAFLDLMLEYASKDFSFTEEDICQEVNTFMFEGYDTTATSITFALYALATHLEIQEKAYTELQAIFADDPKRNATYRDLQEMKYLEMVIKESLRMYATIPMFARMLTEDTHLNGRLLPKGLTLVIFAYGVQHSDVYENSEIFNPDRFTLENSRDRHSFGYVPFSAGPRNCIGKKFAMLEMKSTISKVLRSFELLPSIPAHNLVLKSDAVLKSDNGVYIRLKKRV